MCPGRMCSPRCVLCELAEARCPWNDVAHLIRSDFVAAEPEKFTCHVLNLAHTQTQRHQPGAHRHQASAHQPRESAIAAGSRNRSFCSRNMLEQRLNLVRGPLRHDTTTNCDNGVS